MKPIFSIILFFSLAVVAFGDQQNIVVLDAAKATDYALLKTQTYNSHFGVDYELDRVVKAVKYLDSDEVGLRFIIKRDENDKLRCRAVFSEEKSDSGSFLCKPTKRRRYQNNVEAYDMVNATIYANLKTETYNSHFNVSYSLDRVTEALKYLDSDEVGLKFIIKRDENDKLLCHAVFSEDKLDARSLLCKPTKRRQYQGNVTPLDTKKATEYALLKTQTYNSHFGVNYTLDRVLKSVKYLDSDEVDLKFIIKRDDEKLICNAVFPEDKSDSGSFLCKPTKRRRYQKNVEAYDIVNATIYANLKTETYNSHFNVSYSLDQVTETLKYLDSDEVGLKFIIKRDENDKLLCHAVFSEDKSDAGYLLCKPCKPRQYQRNVTPLDTKKATEYALLKTQTYNSHFGVNYSLDQIVEAVKYLDSNEVGLQFIIKRSEDDKLLCHAVFPEDESYGSFFCSVGKYRDYVTSLA